MAHIAIDAARKDPTHATTMALLQSIDAASDIADEEAALLPFRGARLGQRGLIAGTTIAVVVALAIGIVLDLAHLNGVD